MPMYSGFDDRFDAALANKMKTQDATSAASLTNASANMMNAQTQQGLAPAEALYRDRVGQAGLLRAGTERGQLASDNPLGFSQNQVNTMGLGNMGFSASPLTTLSATDQLKSLYGGKSENAYLADMQKKPGLRRGGVIGDVGDDEGEDTQAVKARPGEYYINPETVAHGFGGGDYERGVRSLDEIVRRATGQEPGPTYSKKANADYEAAAGGVIPRSPQDDAAYRDYLTRLTSQVSQIDPNAAARMVQTAPPVQGLRAAPDYVDGRDALLARQAQPRAAPAPRAIVPSNADWNAHVASVPQGKGGYPLLMDKGGAMPLKKRRKVAPVANPVLESPAHGIQQYTNQPGEAYPPQVPSTTADAGFVGKQMVNIPAPQPQAEPVDMQGLRAQYGRTQDLDALRARAEAIAPGSVSIQDEMLARQGADPAIQDPRMVQARRNAAAPALAARFAMPVPSTASPLARPGLSNAQTPAAVALKKQYDMGAETGVSSNPNPLFPVRQQGVITEGDDNKFAIRNAIQKGGAPGQQIAFSYGEGFGMGPDAKPITATADASGRFNSFSNLGPSSVGPAPVAAAPTGVRAKPAFEPGGITPATRAASMAAPAANAPLPYALGAGPAMAKPDLEKAIIANNGLRMARGGRVPGFVKGGANDPFAEYGRVIHGVDPYANAEFGGPNVDPVAQQLQARADLARQQAEAARLRQPHGPDFTGPPEFIGPRQPRFGPTPDFIGPQPFIGPRQPPPGPTPWYKANVEDAAVNVAKKTYGVAKSTLGPVLRGASRFAAPVGAVMSLGETADVFTDPKMTGLDKATEVAQQAGRWGTAGAGAAIGSAFGGPIGGLAGGVAGYFGGNALINIIRGEDSPSSRSQGAVKKFLGTGAGDVPTDEKGRAANEMARAAAEDDARSRGPQMRGLAPEPGAGAAAAPKPSLRDMMLMRALVGSRSEQGHLLNYLASTDPSRRSGSGEDSAARLQEAHEKEIEASLRPRFKTTTKDDKGKVTETDDLPGYERFMADMATRNIPIFNMSRTQRDRALAEWQARDRVEQRTEAIQAASGDPNQLRSNRVEPMRLREGPLTVGDWWGSPNIGIGDLGQSVFNRGLRNRVAVRELIDPATGKPVKQLYPAAKVFGDDKGIDVDALRYTQGR